MIPISGRTDVLVQWFSDDFIKKNEKVFEKITVGPGEVLIIIKDGKPSDTYLESSVKLAGDGFLAKFREKLKGVNNQVLMADLRPFAARIGIHGYTKDRTEIEGAMNLTVRVSKENMVRLSSLYTRDLLSDEKWKDMRGKVKEVTREDIENILRYDTELTVDSSVLTQTLSSDIRDHQDVFNARVRNAIDSMTPVWANCGLAVDVVKVDIEKNAYEDAMRYHDEQSKAQMKMDADFETAAHELGLKMDYGILFVKKEAEEELEKAKGEYEVQNFWFTKEMEDELAKTDHEIELQRRDIISKLEFAKVQADIDHINSVSDDEIRRRKADTDAYVEMAQIKNNEYVKDQDVRRQIELMQAQRDIEIQNAYEDGKKNGKQLAEDSAFDMGYSKGYADGLKEAMRNGPGQTVVMPGYGMPPAYGYPPAPPYQGGYDDRRRYDDYDDRRYRDDDRRYRDDDRRQPRRDDDRE